MIKSYNYITKNSQSNSFGFFALRKFINDQENEPFYILRTDYYLPIISKKDIINAVFQFEVINLERPKYTYTLW